MMNTGTHINLHVHVNDSLSIYIYIFHVLMRKPLVAISQFICINHHERRKLTPDYDEGSLEANRDVRRDVTGLRIYLCGGQEIKNFACLSMKAQL